MPQRGVAIAGLVAGALVFASCSLAVPLDELLGTATPAGDSGPSSDAVADVEDAGGDAGDAGEAGDAGDADGSDGDAKSDACPAGYADCRDGGATRCETLVRGEDPLNCGACGRSCGGAACYSGGVCAAIVIASGQPFPTGLAVDDGGVYWANQGISGAGGGIMKAPLDGGVATQIVVEPRAFGIALDDNSVYWTAQGSVPFIRRADKNADAGANVRTLATSVSPPYYLAVDGTRVYWTVHLANGQVLSAALDGGVDSGVANKVIAANQFLPTGVARSGGYFYWTTQETPQGGAIRRVPLAGGAVETLATGQPLPDFVAVNTRSVFWTSRSGAGALTKVEDGGSPLRLTPNGNAGALGIAVDDMSVYWCRSDGVFRLRLTGNEAPVQLAVDSCLNIAIDDTWVYWTISTQDGYVAKTLR